MKIRRFWWIAVIAGAAALLGAWLAIPVLAAPFRQADGVAPDAYAAMHEACEVGDVQGVADAMDSLDEEDWEAMHEHMSDDHQGDMGSHMTGEDWEAMHEHMSDDHQGSTVSSMMGIGMGMMGGMMGGQPGQGMMGW